VPGPSQHRVLVAAALVVASAGGCTSSHAGATPTFDDQQLRHVSCLAHQGRPPSALYRPGSQENTRATLRVLAYYTSNGNKPYCDGRAATATDRSWARLYVRLGADATHVAAILDADRG